MYANLRAGVSAARHTLGFPFLRRTNGRDAELNAYDVHFVARALRQHRERQAEQESIFVEGAFRLQEGSEQLIRALVGADDSVPIRFVSNPALLTRVQVYYRGQVFTSPPVNSIDRLKTLF